MAANQSTHAQPVRRRRAAYAIIAVLCAWVALMAMNSPGARAPIVCDQDRVADRNTVVMLSASWCGYCRRARDYMQSVGIAHCEYDVETNPEGRRQFSAMARKVIPVIKIRDDVLIGFDRDALVRALVAHSLAQPGEYD
jgi:glutaredoxin